MKRYNLESDFIGIIIKLLILYTDTPKSQTIDERCIFVTLYIQN